MLNSFLWTLNGFCKSILGPETRMCSGEESCRDVLTLSAGLRWGFEPLCLLGDKALTLVWLRLGNNSRLWTSCWQVTTWWWLFYFGLFDVLCCTLECFLHQNLWLGPASLPPPESNYFNRHPVKALGEYLPHLADPQSTP